MTQSLLTRLALAAAILVAIHPGKGQAGELIFGGSGGAYQDAVREAWLTPFGKSSNTLILEDTGISLAKIRAMVESHAVTWDVVGMSGAAFMQGVHMGLFAPIPDGVVDRAKLIPGAWNRYGVPSEMLSVVMAYSKAAFPKDAPKTLADFWDVKRFPGQRILPSRPAGLVEAALLADGVPARDVYATLSTPAGLKRAFDKIRAIRPNVAFWWGSGAQSVQALASGDAVMALGWNGRFQDGIDAGLPIAIAWQQSVSQIDYFLMLKGAPDGRQALDFLHYISSVDAQARLSKFVAYGPTRTDAWDRLDPHGLDRLPPRPDGASDTLVIDNAWWSDHAANITAKLLTVMQGG